MVVETNCICCNEPGILFKNLIYSGKDADGNKIYECTKCFYYNGKARHHVSFDPVFALHNYVYYSSKEGAEYYKSLKIYKCADNSNGIWAYVISINGDYTSIREAHVYSWIVEHGGIPDEIDHNELRNLAQTWWNKQINKSKCHQPYAEQLNL